MSDTTQSKDSQRKLLANRIRTLRDRLNVTQEQLAQKAGLPAPQTVSQIEKCERDVKVVELAQLATALHVTIPDLLGNPPRKNHVLWRDRPAEGSEEAEAKFLETCHNYRLAEEWADAVPDADLEQLPMSIHLDDYRFVERQAERTRSRLGLGTYPAASLTHVLEEGFGVKILYQPGLGGSAACAIGDFGSAILVNASEVPWRRNYSIAHELFHLVTWDSLPPDSLQQDPDLWQRAERLANVFASALLLPAEALLSRLRERQEKSPMRLIDLVELAREFDVSVEALLWRLVHLKHLDADTARSVIADGRFRSLDQASLRQSEYPEPHMIPPRMLDLLFAAYTRGDVSAARVAEMTGMSLVEVHRRLSSLEEETELGQTQLGVA